MEYETNSTYPAEQVVNLKDLVTGLDGVIVIHSTALGPAAGGCRYWSYGSSADLLLDATRLAAGMAFKNAIAGLPLGGGKAVLRHGGAALERRQSVFEAFGAAVERLNGRYVTAEDVGTTLDDMQVVARRTRFVAGLPAVLGRPGGDPSPWTARGVLLSMRVAAQARLAKPLRECTVAVQGLGNVGSRLSRMLNDEGARLVVSDIDRRRAEAAARMTGATVVAPEDILAADVDILAPCALGAVLSHRSIPGLRARIVCGGANNQLAEREDGLRLADRDILYAPDYVVNAGGIINVAAEYLGWEASKASELVEATGRRLENVLSIATTAGSSPNDAADRLAESIISTGAAKLRA